MKSLLLILFLSLVFITQESQTSNTDLVCTLKSDKSSYKLGEKPKFKVKIHNHSKADIYLIGSLDGSEVKWRFPHCYFTIDKPKPDTIDFSRCGNMNTLLVEDFKLVQSGQEFNPYESILNFRYVTDYTLLEPETFRNPGVYKIKFYYSTNSDNISDYWGDKYDPIDLVDSLKMDNYFKSVPKVDLVSNEVVIEISN